MPHGPAGINGSELRPGAGVQLQHTPGGFQRHPCGRACRIKCDAKGTRADGERHRGDDRARTGVDDAEGSRIGIRHPQPAIWCQSQTTRRSAHGDLGVTRTSHHIKSSDAVVVHIHAPDAVIARGRMLIDDAAGGSGLAWGQSGIHRLVESAGDRDAGVIGGGERHQIASRSGIGVRDAQGRQPGGLWRAIAKIPFVAWIDAVGRLHVECERAACGLGCRCKWLQCQPGGDVPNEGGSGRCTEAIAGAEDDIEGACGRQGTRDDSRTWRDRKSRGQARGAEGDRIVFWIIRNDRQRHHGTDERILDTRIGDLRR